MDKGLDDGLRIGAAAGYGPRAPYLTPGARVDLGPAGSLIQARGWLRTARISRRPAAQRDWRLHAAAALTAAAVVLLALGVGPRSATRATNPPAGRWRSRPTVWAGRSSGASPPPAAAVGRGARSTGTARPLPCRRWR